MVRPRCPLSGSLLQRFLPVLVPFSAGLPPGGAAPADPFRPQVLAASCGGILLFSSVLLSLPLTSQHLARMQALNRALGKLCADPPPQAITVCRLHAGLVRGL